MSTIRKDRRTRIKKGIRGKVSGSSQRPRLTIFRSNKRIYAQLIDDVAAVTLIAASSQEIEATEKGFNLETAAKVGKNLAQKALEKGINTVVFDRNGYLYHGKVKALADGAREAGLKF